MDTVDLPPIPAEKGEWDAEALSRRRFLEASVMAVTGVATLAVVGASGRYLAGRAFEPQPATWVQIGPVTELPAGKVHRASYGQSIKDAWRKIEQKGIVYVYSESGDSYTALDGTCSHLGCVTHWQEEGQHFACPCHSGYFERDGAVKDGPPPKPLRKLATKVEEGVLWAEI